jgi:hypothetical protein
MKRKEFQNQMNEAIELMKTASTFISENNTFKVKELIPCINALNRLIKTELHYSDAVIVGAKQEILDLDHNSMKSEKLELIQLISNLR